MKFISLCFAIALLGISAAGQDPACKSVQKGAFKIFTKETGTTFIRRTAKEQVEKNDDLGYEVIFSIRWIDECTYELRPKKLIRGDPAIMGDGSQFVRTRIRDITETGYVAETTSSFSDATMNFTVEIVKK